MAKQVQKEFDSHEAKMATYLDEVRRVESFFDRFEVRYVPRLDNRDTDHLAWLSSSRSAIPDDVIREVLTKPSVILTTKASAANLINNEEAGAEEDWRTPYLMWLNEEMTPDDSVMAELLARNARRYIVIDGQLYCKGANT